MIVAGIAAHTGSGNMASPRRSRRKAEETRADILVTADMLFRQNGFQTVSIADIAMHIGMSPANVFKHFRSKSLLVEAIAEQHIKRLEANLAGNAAMHPPETRLLRLAQRLMAQHLLDLEENPYIFEMMLMVAGRELQCGQHYRDLILSNITDIIASGTECGVYAVTDARKAATTVMHALSCVLHPVLLAKENPDILATRCVEVVALIEAGLRKPLEE